MKEVLVSILIPVYNRESIVGKTIESALNQTYKNIEIILVDNCSTDNSWSILQSYSLKDKRIKIFKNPKNLGPVLNWKRCIDEASGEYCKILFSDDLISSNFIDETLNLFNESTSFVLSRIKVFSYENDISSNFYKGQTFFSREEYFKNILLTNLLGFPVSPGAALFRTIDLNKSLETDIENPLDLDFKVYGAGNDLLIYLNIALKYKEVRVASNAFAYFRAHDQSFSIANKLDVYYDYSKLYFIRKYFPEYISKFNALLWLRKLKRGKDKNLIYNEINTNIHLIFFLKAIWIRMIGKQRIKYPF